jgi:hypothetical protein
MKVSGKVALAVSLTVTASTVVAGEQIYTCKALTISKLSDEGRLSPGKLPSQELRIPPFVVVRDTGLAQGFSFGLADFKPHEVRVLSRGNAKNSFVAVYSFPRPYEGAAIATLVVREFFSSSQKPFILLAADRVVSGVCE